MKTELKGLESQEIEEWALNQGLEAFRGRQIRQWLFKGLVSTYDEMTNLPKDLRRELNKVASINHLEHVEMQESVDGTRKFLFTLADGQFIESVLIPERDHFTLCISSQSGCAMGCRFCLTGEQGLNRNLSPAEIVDQVVSVKRSMEERDRLTNVVFMGMGEPLANYGAVIKAIKNLIADDGMNLSHRKVTLSTCGLAPEIERLGQDVTVNLAVSLNASNDKTRSYLMPINRKYPLERLISCCRGFSLPKRGRITFEYILIKGINDSDEDALNLTKLLAPLRAKINLIPLNDYPGHDMGPPSNDRIFQFQQILANKHFTAIIRKSKGRDILAACGQLKGAWRG